MIFSGFLWAPIFDKHNEIFEEINQSITVRNFYIYHFENSEIYINMIKHIYKTDDISQENIAKKIENLIMFSQKCIYFSLEISEPVFRKKSNGNKISTIVEKLKKTIRNKYKQFVSNYIHDNIIHITDNEEQTLQIHELMNNYNNYMTFHFVNIKFLLNAQFNNEIFTRVDMLVRKVVIEKFIDPLCTDSTYYFKVYTKMQKLRGTYKTHNINRFKKLISSLESSTYDTSSTINVRPNYIFTDGSHRLAYLYLKDYTFVSCKPTMVFQANTNDAEKIYINYSMKWFEKRFSKRTCNMIKNELNKLKDYLK